MANGGGLVLDRVAGVLRCPVVGCHWSLRVTDLGQFVDLGVSEDDIRAHLASHPVEDWLRTLSSHQTTIRGLIGRVETETARVQRFREDAAHREFGLLKQRDDAVREAYRLARLLLDEGMCVECGGMACDHDTSAIEREVRDATA